MTRLRNVLRNSTVLGPENIAMPRVQRQLPNFVCTTTTQTSRLCFLRNTLVNDYVIRLNVGPELCGNGTRCHSYYMTG